MQDLTQASIEIRRWADLWQERRTLHGASERAWEPVDQVVQAARRVWDAQASRVRALIEESNQRHRPLRDPLLIGLGLHRWLSTEREEAYSDWLEWIIKQLPGPDVLGLFGIDVPVGAARAAGTFSTKREEWVKLDHWSSYKKLDLVIRYAASVLIVVEVKVTDAEQADTAKQREYAEWAKGQRIDHTRLVLLANAGAKPDYEDFRLVTWQHLCVKLRRVLPELIRSAKMDIVQAALTLAFVGAVEQNLLGFPGREALFGSDPAVGLVVEHLKKALDSSSR